MIRGTGHLKIIIPKS